MSTTEFGLIADLQADVARAFRLTARVAAGAGLSTNIAVSGIKTTDQIVGSLNLTDLTDLAVDAKKADENAWGDSSYDAGLAATTAGAAGNAITIRLIGDSATGAGVAIVRNDTHFVIHYESGVSTVADVNTAIEALAGANDLFGVASAGTEAAALTSPADDCEPVALNAGYDAYIDVPAITSDGNVQLAGYDSTDKKLLVLFFAS